MTGTARTWDLLVVGGGTAGLIAAKTAAGLGARVVLVEADRTGGDCLWTGCVPSKSLLAAAGAAHRARHGADLGVRVSGVEVDFAVVRQHVQRAIETIEPVDSPAALEQAGVTVLRGHARFADERAVDVAGQRVRFRRALVATGAEPVLPDVPGLADARLVTTETVWDLESLPGRLVVLGAGSVGCELAQAFARLGSQVTLVEAESRVLPDEDPDASSVVAAALAADEVEIVLQRRASLARRDIVVLDDGRQVPCDVLLVATGRRPRTRELGLDQAGVRCDEQGFVEVDETLRTANPRVFAAGDVTPHPQFTHVAGVHGSVAAMNAVLGLRRRAETRVVPRVTYTDPEVAAVGAATWGAGTSVVTLPSRHVDRAVTENRTEGFTRLALDDDHRVVGATVVGPRAGEVLGELSLAVAQRLSTRDLTGVMHAYPTYNDGLWHGAILDAQARLRSPWAKRATRAVTRLRRIVP